MFGGLRFNNPTKFNLVPWPIKSLRRGAKRGKRFASPAGIKRRAARINANSKATKATRKQGNPLVGYLVILFLLVGFPLMGVPVWIGPILLATLATMGYVSARKEKRQR
jgi:hypothetical protein